jgi:hypothetical protein
MGKHLQLCGLAHHRATRKNLESRNTLLESDEQVLRMFKVSAITDAIRRSILINQQQQQQCLPQFKSILDGQLSRQLLPAPFHLKIANTPKKFDSFRASLP